MVFDPLVAVESLYIHWPFCPYRCNFCPFVALAGHDHFMDQYHRALQKEIINYGKSCLAKQPIKTLFMGGGTPSTYPPLLLLETFGILKELFVFAPDAEITIEVNPGTVNQEKLEAWKQAGINRLSIGVQSLDDAVLKKLNRHQSAQDVINLLKQAQHLFDNLSVDLIIGLPEVTEERWKMDLAELMRWPLTHISLYFLTVHEETPLYYGVKKKKIALLPDDKLVDLYNWSVGFLKEHGFVQYEVSNFARPGYESKHNSVYWNRSAYKGFGLGAASFDGTSRLQNDKRLIEYLEGITLGKNVSVMSELLTEDQVWLERLMLGLRQAQGIDVDDLTKLLSVDKQLKFMEQVKLLSYENFLTYDGKRASLTSKGLALASEITVQLSL